jgi:hypothetical protein
MHNLVTPPIDYTDYEEGNVKVLWVVVIACCPSPYLLTSFPHPVSRSGAPLQPAVLLHGVCLIKHVKRMQLILVRNLCANNKVPVPYNKFL